MTPTERRRETARELLRLIRHPYVVCSDEVALSSLYSSLAKAEREGMKRAAEIASRDADWSRFGKREVHEPWEGGPDDARDYRIGIVAGRAIAAAILSEAGESE